MKETTRAFLMLAGFALIILLGYKFLPSRTSLDTAQENFRKTSEQVKLYADKKSREAVESTKVVTKTLEERIEFLEKQDLTADVLLLQQQVDNLVTENGQLKIYIATLETKITEGIEVDKNLLLGAQAHYNAYLEFKANTENLFKLLGTALGTISSELTSLDTRLDKVEAQEKSVLTKQTIIKTYYCYPRRCCR